MRFRFIYFVIFGFLRLGYCAQAQTSWTNQSPTMLQVVFRNGRFLAVGDVTEHFAAGHEWTQRIPSPPGVKSIAFGDGKFMATDIATIQSSTDGLAWKTVFNPGQNRHFNYVGFGNHLFYAIEGLSFPTGASLLASTDGEIWAKAADFPGLSLTAFSFG